MLRRNWTQLSLYPVSPFVCRRCNCTAVGVASSFSAETPSDPLQTQARQFLNKISDQLGLKKRSDWYNVSHRWLAEKADPSIFKQHPSLEAMLRFGYPEYPWESSKFPLPAKPKQRRRRWANMQVQRQLMNKIGKELGVLELSDWYAIKRKEVESKGGSGLFGYYTSLSAALEKIYPEYAWDQTRFLVEGSTPKGFWSEKANQMKALELLEQRLEIKQPEDWYSVTVIDLRDLGFPVRIPKAQIAGLLNEKYPGYEWENALNPSRHHHQKRIERLLPALFPGEDFKINTRREAGLRHPITHEYLSLDIYIPSLKLAFTFKEKSHIPTLGGKESSILLDAATREGISVVTIPSWWDGKTQSLTATIKKARPDLLSQEHAVAPEDAIPEEAPPPSDTEQTGSIPDIGEPILASVFHPNALDPKGWWLSEKYDGVRCFWNPRKKAFYSRQGKQFFFPEEIVKAMPNNTFLDGELWFGPDSFEDAAAPLANKNKPAGLDWNRLKYMVFDIPNHPGTYAERYGRLEELFGTKMGTECKYIRVVPKEVCKEAQHFAEFFQDAIDRGAEGVILRDPSALLEPGRSAGFLKYKKYRDAEAKIIREVSPLKWECELPNGIKFTAQGARGFSKRWKPQQGDIVSFKHYGFLHTNWLPKHPVLFRLRKDLTWDDIVFHYRSKSGRLNSKREREKLAYWQNVDNRRKYFLGLANKLSFDPAVAENWHNVTRSHIKRNKGQAILALFNSSVKEALEKTFPELNIKRTEKKQPWWLYWHDLANCRDFFNSYAKEKGFDPLVASSWYNVLLADLLERPGALYLRNVHNGFKRALIKAYPEVHFADWLSSLEVAYYAEDGTQRQATQNLQESNKN